jgi:hypothetical protein
MHNDPMPLNIATAFRQKAAWLKAAFLFLQCTDISLSLS